MGMSQFVWGFKAGSLLASTSHVPLCVGFLGGKFCHCGQIVFYSIYFNKTGTISYEDMYHRYN